MHEHVRRYWAESGADRIRATANVLNNSREDSLGGYSATELLNIVQACRVSDWDITPCDLIREERNFAAANGALSLAAVKRLTERLG